MTRGISSDLLLLIHYKDNSRGDGPGSATNNEIEQGQDALVRPCRHTILSSFVIISSMIIVINRALKCFYWYTLANQYAQGRQHTVHVLQS